MSSPSSRTDQIQPRAHVVAFLRQVAYSPDPVEPPAGGSALICCAQSLDNVVLEDP